MLNPILMCLLLCLTGNSVSAQQKTTGDAPAMQQNDEQLRDCRRMIDADIFPSETCSAILTYMSPADQLGPVSEDGSFIVLSPAPDRKTNNARTYYLPPKLRSEIALNTIKGTLDDVEFVAKDEPGSLIAAMSPQGQDLWLKLRDVYCYYHPKGIYTDLSENKQTCVAVQHLPDEKTLEGEFNGALIFKVNYLTFLNDRIQAKLERETANQTKPAQGDQMPHDGQSTGSYIHDMGEALVPYGTITAPNCHKVEIELHGLWGQYAIPSGINQQKPDELLWAIININVFRIFVDLSTLNEDKVKNQGIFSLKYVASHRRGPHVPDIPMVMIVSQGLNSEMIDHEIDLDKIKALEGRTDIRESELGLTIHSHKSAFILFQDQEHADAFEKAIKKAIVVCKAKP